MTHNVWVDFKPSFLTVVFTNVGISHKLDEKASFSQATVTSKLSCVWTSFFEICVGVFHSHHTFGLFKKIDWNLFSSYNEVQLQFFLIKGLCLRFMAIWPLWLSKMHELCLRAWYKVVKVSVVQVFSSKWATFRYDALASVLSNFSVPKTL